MARVKTVTAHIAWMNSLMKGQEVALVFPPSDLCATSRSIRGKVTNVAATFVAVEVTINDWGVGAFKATFRFTRNTGRAQHGYLRAQLAPRP